MIHANFEAGYYNANILVIYAKEYYLKLNKHKKSMSTHNINFWFENILYEICGEHYD